ncbi:DUF5316 domain-containing protein [Bacillus sp. FJAT-50079]|uniref:DUF5316 domain-containing protein n=1 Tax=Bacillus sp. FJAT-50079 TaxID=2833577 RepID=UPI001BC95FEB|nr:DUF5316 domain-containing protein [Bacillus sp. FJAT-50079]MBS4209031.1 DUF5316 domain-containing protein [Bacillus sp. FJAT-50079]
MRAFYVGLIIIVIAIVVSLSMNDWKMMYKICGIAGLISLALSALSVGALADGERTRIDLNTEIRGEKRVRLKSSAQLLLIAIPNIVVAVLMYYFIIM